MEGRKMYYIDNIRWICILFLFVYHTCMIYNNFDEGFYVWAGENAYLSGLIIVCSPWFMPLLFVLAGISTRYALKKRTPREYILERIKRVLVGIKK